MYLRDSYIRCITVTVQHTVICIEDEVFCQYQQHVHLDSPCREPLHTAILYHEFVVVHDYRVWCDAEGVGSVVLAVPNADRAHHNAEELAVN